MATTITYKIIDKYRNEDHLMTQVIYTFAGDVSEENIKVEVAHYRPASIAAVEAAIIARGEHEIQKLLAARTIDDILDGIVIGK